MSAAAGETVWARGRLDARSGPRQLLFGRMHEDVSVELGAFRPGGRVFCIASAGCTAMALSITHEVVAVDVNPAQIEYARRRFAGGPAVAGAAERLMRLARAFAPLAGWSRATLTAFLDLDDPKEQLAFWRRRLDGRRFRAAMALAFSKPLLSLFYAEPLLASVPRRFGAVLRARMERCFARHPNRQNQYARDLLLGEVAGAAPPAEARAIRLVEGDAAAVLEREPPASFTGFTLSNVLDGAGSAYRARLLAAVKRAAAPGAVLVVRSFSEPAEPSTTNLAAEDRSMLWGVVDARPLEAW